MATSKAFAIDQGRIKHLAGREFIDAALEVGGVLQTDKQIELVAISTPSATPATNHSFVWYDTGKILYIKHYDGSVVAVGGGIGGVSAGYGLVGGGTTGIVLVALDVNTTSFIHNQTTSQSATLWVTSGTIDNFTASKATFTTITAGTANIASASVTNSTVTTITVGTINGYTYGRPVMSAATVTTSSSTTATVFVPTALTVTTPAARSASSCFKVWATGTLENSSGNNNAYATIQRNGTNIYGTDGLVITATNVAGANRFPATLIAYDCPATTSAVTYRVAMRGSGGTTTFGDSSNNSQQIIVEEIP